jgi:hypothetical protein
VIYSRDVINITGQSKRTARRIMMIIRKAKNKSSRDMVTIDDFCEVMKFREEVVRAYVV